MYTTLAKSELRDLIQNLDDEKRIHYTRQLLQIACFLDHAEVMHGDISSKNILVDLQDNLIATDFEGAVLSDDPSYQKDDNIFMIGYLIQELWKKKMPSKIQKIINRVLLNAFSLTPYSSEQALSDFLRLYPLGEPIVKRKRTEGEINS